MTARVKVDATGPMKIFRDIQKPRVMLALQAAVGRAGHRVEDSMRNQLNVMIYSLPERGYKRTHTLFRGAHAANPKWNHSDDTFAAEEIDLAVKSDMDIVAVDGFIFTTEIGDWVSYAEAVHEGQGLGQRTPRRFSAQPLMEADGYLRVEVNLAIAAALRGIVP